MIMPGPNPKPLGTHAPGSHRDVAARRGAAPSGAKTSPASPPPTPNDLEPPASIKDDPVACEHWTWCWARLRELGTATRADRVGIERMAVLHSRWIRTERELSETGTFIEEQGRRGIVRKRNPAAEIALGLARELRALASRHGLDAVSRQAMRVPAREVPAINEVAARYIKGRRT